MPDTGPALLLRMEIRDLEAQVRRMGVAFRNKKDAPEFVAAEVSALYHIQEAKRHLDTLSRRESEIPLAGLPKGCACSGATPPVGGVEAPGPGIADKG